MYQVAKDPRYHLRVNVLSRSFSCGALRSQNKGELITECVKRPDSAVNKPPALIRDAQTARVVLLSKASQCVWVSEPWLDSIRPPEVALFVCVLFVWIELFLSAHRQGEECTESRMKGFVLVSLIIDAVRGLSDGDVSFLTPSVLALCCF